MKRTRQIFVMISQTNTAIARAIRVCCRYPYNHVSLTLDPSLRQWYSFARYYQDAPFFSGFIRESAERFLASGKDTIVRIFRLEIPEEKAARLEQLFITAGQPGNGLIYNYFDAVAGVFNCSLTVPNSHTCLSFACSVLEREHKSIESLNRDLEPMLIYAGKLSALVRDSGSREDPYFTSIGLVQGTLHSAKQLAILTGRMIRHSLSSHMAHRFHRMVH